MLEAVANVNNFLNNIFWGWPALILLAFVGVFMTCWTKFFQITHIGHWMKETIGAIFHKDVVGHTQDKSISQFQSLCTALAATVGTGNIVGVAGAIMVGGPGAVFWMWLIAFFGMMTNYSENVLGIYYRRKNERNEWCGGAMYYLKDGLGSYKGFQKIGAVLAVLFSVFCVMASFGIGNMSQINSISGNMKSAFGVPTYVTGIALLILAALVIVGGLKRIASVTEKLVPFMAIIYILGALVLFFMNIDQCGAIFSAIIKGAFGLRAVGGGIVGSGVKMAVTWGMKRGVFSNEAGLGSSVMVHSSSNVKEPVRQGMWGIFEVFADTMIVCTLTAFVSSLTKCSISSARVLMFSAAIRCFSSFLYNPLASAFAFSLIADKGVFMSWERESSRSFLSFCIVISFLRLFSMLSRNRLTPHVNSPKKRLFSSDIGTARLPFASSLGTSLSLLKGMMICLRI